MCPDSPAVITTSSQVTRATAFTGARIVANTASRPHTSPFIRLTHLAIRCLYGSDRMGANSQVPALLRLGAPIHVRTLQVHLESTLLGPARAALLPLRTTTGGDRMPDAEQQPRLGDWLPILRYRRTTACIVVLTCTHSRQMYGTPGVVGTVGRAARFPCGYVRDVLEIRELPMSCENPHAW